MELWEILVPTKKNCGKPIRTRHHREWDRRVRKISGGLTIFKPAKGQWINPAGYLFEERMIPVRVAATRDQLERIIEITLRHYEQEAVMAYQVSSEVIIRHASS